ncbi:DNA alkylation repair protein [Bauldia sp.]|uniref:DNA alkylation repair protein n=1 Tax=Bauldia sp. TaxID=2575872 RepID=UPI003BAC3BC6
MPTNAADILAELKTLGSEKSRAGMARYGINTDKAFGISMAELRPIARRHRRDHTLAAALWDSGYHEARLLAVLIDDPKQVTAEQMDAWSAAFDSWDLCDQACLKLFDKTAFVDKKIIQWAHDEREFVRRAGFALLAAHTIHGKTVPDTTFLDYLPLIERHATDERNFVKKAVNWALRQIGKRSITLHGPALALAERLAEADNKAARWIGRDAARELSDPVQLERIAKRSAK